MSRCQASVRVGQTTKPIEVVFSSGAEVSYISNFAANGLGLLLTTEDTPTTLQGIILGPEFTCTQATSIDLVLGTFRHVINVLVMPGSLPYLVLGMDWFQKYNPRFDYHENIILITGNRRDEHSIRMKKDTDSEKLFVPAVRVVSRNMDPEDKTTKSLSRYRIIKDGWGNRRNFQASYGLTMSPDDIEEGNEILKAMEKADEESRQTSQR